MSNAPYPGHPDYNVEMSGEDLSPAPIPTPQHTEYQGQSERTQPQPQPQSQPQPQLQNPDQFTQLLTALTAALQYGQAPPARSEKTADVPAFSGAGAHVSDDLERFKIGLEAKFRVNADRYTTPESRVYYAFARTTDRATSIVQDNVRIGHYRDWTALIEELELALGDADPVFSASRRLLGLRQTHRPFSDFYPEFQLAARRTPFAGQALKQVLRVALSRELSERLSAVDVRKMEYEAFVQECLRQDNLLRAVSSRPPNKPWRPAPALSPAPVLAPARLSVPLPVPAASRPAPATALPSYDPMEIDRSRRQTFQDRELERTRRREQRLCFYCGQPDHVANNCPEKSRPRLPVRSSSPVSPPASSRPLVPVAPVSHPAAPPSRPVDQESLKDQFLD